jgi:hypothetical protein
MSDRSERISRLKADRNSRESYIKAKLGTLVPSQIRALRLKSRTPKQTALARVAETYQSRLSSLERPGQANVTLETLAWIASVHKVGLIVKFVSFSEMLRWENNYFQDTFTVTPLDQDEAFLNPKRTADISSVYVGTGLKVISKFTMNDNDTILELQSQVPAKDSFKPMVINE